MACQQLFFQHLLNAPHLTRKYSFLFLQHILSSLFVHICCSWSHNQALFFCTPPPAQYSKGSISVSAKVQNITVTPKQYHSSGKKQNFEYKFEFLSLFLPWPNVCISMWMWNWLHGTVFVHLVLQNQHVEARVQLVFWSHPPQRMWVSMADWRLEFLAPALLAARTRRVIGKDNFSWSACWKTSLNIRA